MGTRTNLCVLWKGVEGGLSCDHHRDAALFGTLKNLLRVLILALGT